MAAILNNLLVMRAQRFLLGDCRACAVYTDFYRDFYRNARLKFSKCSNFLLIIKAKDELIVYCTAENVSLVTLSPACIIHCWRRWFALRILLLTLEIDRDVYRRYFRELRVDFQYCVSSMRIRTECSQHVNSFIDAY